MLVMLSRAYTKNNPVEFCTRTINLLISLGYMKKRGVTADLVKLFHCVKDVSYNEENKVHAIMKKIRYTPLILIRLIVNTAVIFSSK